VDQISETVIIAKILEMLKNTSNTAKNVKVCDFSQKKI
jgi:hypothetical protein